MFCLVCATDNKNPPGSGFDCKTENLRATNYFDVLIVIVDLIVRGSLSMALW